MKSTVKFTQITEFLNYPPSVRALLSTAHSNLVVQASQNFSGSLRDRQKLANALNVISYIYVSGDSLPVNWYPEDPLNNLPDIPDETLKSVLKDLYVTETSINFDIERTESVKPIVPTPIQKIESPEVSTIKDTPKTDLYIQPPVVPKFDVTSFQEVFSEYGVRYGLYNSLPLVPTKQNEISATTDINMFQESDFKKLFPNILIHTRSESMYVPCDGVKMHPVLGLILPISGYTEKQVVDNLVKYPHLFRLQKCVDDEVVSFYSTVEIDGQLVPISEVWSSLEESKKLPYTSEFVKEYVVRRYLLERDVKKVDHRYKMYGTLDPFLTLFAPSDTYIELGYTNISEIAKKCVQARVSYKRSRNPVLRRLNNV